jgi:hypothetical protein
MGVCVRARSHSACLLQAQDVRAVAEQLAQQVLPPVVPGQRPGGAVAAVQVVLLKAHGTCARTRVQHARARQRFCVFCCGAWGGSTHVGVEVRQHVVGEDGEAPQALRVRHERHEAAQRRGRRRDDARAELQLRRRARLRAAGHVNRHALEAQHVAHVLGAGRVGARACNLHGNDTRLRASAQGVRMRRARGARATGAPRRRPRGAPTRPTRRSAAPAALRPAGARGRRANSAVPMFCKGNNAPRSSFPSRAPSFGETGRWSSCGWV